MDFTGSMVSIFPMKQLQNWTFWVIIEQRQSVTKLLLVLASILGSTVLLTVPLATKLWSKTMFNPVQCVVSFEINEVVIFFQSSCFKVLDDLLFSVCNQNVLTRNYNHLSFILESILPTIYLSHPRVFAVFINIFVFYPFLHVVVILHN